MAVSHNIFILAALITTAIAAGGAPENIAESVNTLQDQTEVISEVNTQKKRMAILEEAIGETVARLLEKMNEMQRTVDDLRASNSELWASNYELRASIDDHKTTIDQLTDYITAANAPNIEQTASNTNLTSRMGFLERSTAEPTICAGVRECLNVRAEVREALSKDLYNAADRGNAEEVRRLVAEGARFEYRDNLINETALHIAALYGRVDALRALIELGAPLEARNIYANTPLQRAIWNNQEKCVELLLSAGASVLVRNHLGQTPLHFAVLLGQSSIIQKLIDAGADRTAKDNNGNTPKNVTNDADIIDILNNYFPVRKI